MASIKGKLDKITGRAVLDVIIIPSLAYRQAIGIKKFEGKTNIQIKSEYQFSGKALIDTGASVTSVDSTVAEALELVPKGLTPVKSVTGQHDHSVFDIDLLIGMDKKSFRW